MAKKLRELSEVIGQSNIVRWFEGCIKRDSLPQVVMLAGPTGIGKTSIANIVACEIAYMNHPERKEEGKHAVIDEGKSTDCVRLYNMSNLKSQEAVSEVKNDLSIGFSTTGRKVIIMDEAHGMSNDAQDSLLVAFEHLQNQVYIIVCSTELESFQSAFVGRCILRRLTNLSQADMTRLLRKRIDDNKLKFQLSLPMVYSLICVYTGREPRRALNLLDSFEPGTTVTTEDLQTFINVYEGKQIVTLIDYLYQGAVLKGLEFIAEMDVDTTFVSTLLDVLRIAKGGRATVIDKDAALHIRELVESDSAHRLLGFCVNCSTDNRLTRNKVSGYFLRWCYVAEEREKREPQKMNAEQVHVQDVGIMTGLIEQAPPLIDRQGMQPVQSLEEMLKACETII